MILRGMSGRNIRGSTPFLTGTAIKKGGGPTVHTSAIGTAAKPGATDARAVVAEPAC